MTNERPTENNDDAGRIEQDNNSGGRLTRARECARRARAKVSPPWTPDGEPENDGHRGVEVTRGYDPKVGETVVFFGPAEPPAQDWIQAAPDDVVAVGDQR